MDVEGRLESEIDGRPAQTVVRDGRAVAMLFDIRELRWNYDTERGQKLWEIAKTRFEMNTAGILEALTVANGTKVEKLRDWEAGSWETAVAALWAWYSGYNSKMLEDVARKDDGLPVSASFLNQRKHDASRRGVERGSRLVEDQDLHRVGEDLRERELLLHARRVGSQPSSEVELHHALSDRHSAIKADTIAQIRKHLQRGIPGHRAVHP